MAVDQAHFVSELAQRELEQIQHAEKKEGKGFVTFEYAGDWIRDRNDEDLLDPLVRDPTLAPKVWMELSQLLVQREERLSPSERASLRLPRRATRRAFARMLAIGEVHRILAWGFSGPVGLWVDVRSRGFLSGLDEGMQRNVHMDITKILAGFSLDVRLEVSGRSIEEPQLELDEAAEAWQQRKEGAVTLHQGPPPGVAWTDGDD